MKKNKNWIRNYHRDIGYFYVGLIISFSISGIALNHRTDWDPQDYVYHEAETTTSPFSLKDIQEETVNNKLRIIQRDLDIELQLRGFRERQGRLQVFVEDGIVSMDPKTGKVKLEIYRKIPVLGHMTWLHKTTNHVWIWYSDVFGLGMLAIALTGMFIVSGKNSFRQRGLILALAGVLFPFFALIFLL